VNPTFNLVQQTLSRHGKVDPETIFLHTSLEDINIDSLTVAEMMFEFEDGLEVQFPDVAVMPKTVADLVTLVEPYFIAKNSLQSVSMPLPIGP
jgi:acyl carrier protein